MNDNGEFMVIPESPIDEFSVPSQPNYNQNAQAGAHVAQGQPVHQGYSQPGTAFTGGASQQPTQGVQGMQGQPGVQGVPNPSGQGMPGQGVPQQRQVTPQQRQMPPQQRVPNQGVPSQQPGGQGQPIISETPPKPKKKFPKILIILPLLVALIGGGIIVGIGRAHV